MSSLFVLFRNFLLLARMEIGKMSLKDAAKETVFKKLPGAIRRF